MDTKKSFHRRITDLKIRYRLYKKRVRNPEFSKRLTSVLKHYITVFLAIMTFYLMLLLLLIRAEMESPDASIQTLGQAVWHSLTTFTTVGYGDLCTKDNDMDNFLDAAERIGISKRSEAWEQKVKT